MSGLSKNNLVTRLSLLIIPLFLTQFLAIAQSPNAFPFHSIATDSLGEPYQEQQISVRIALISGGPSGTEEYVETHIDTTDIDGGFFLEIGRGNIVSGTFENIEWGKNTYFIKAGIDISGGTNYQEIGTSQLLSVPYALHANNVSDDNHKVLPTIASLREFSDPNISSVNIRGYHDEFDGAGGQFVLNTDDNSSVDNGGTIIVDNSNRRWKRVYSGAIQLKWFGAIANDNIPDNQELQKALNYIGTLNSMTPFHNLTPNFGLTTLDLGGGEYIVESGLLLPNGGGFVIRNGIISVSEQSSDFEWMFEDNSNVHDNIHFKDLILNCRRKSNGIKLDNSIRSTLSRVTILANKEIGLQLGEYCHEVIVTESFFFQHFNATTYVANTIGIKIGNEGEEAASDNHFNNIVIRGNEVGILSVKGTANIFDKVHIYEAVYGMRFLNNTAANRVLGCYFDGCKLSIAGPNRMLVTNSYFIYTGGLSNFAFIELESNFTGPQNIRGLNISNNIFDSNVASIEAIKVIQSGHGFNNNGIYDSFIGNNQSNANVNIRGTHFSIKKVFNPTNPVISTSVDVSTKYLFGTVEGVKIGVTNYNGGSNIAAANVTGISGNSISLSFSAPVNGSIYVDIVTSK